MIQINAMLLGAPATAGLSALGGVFGGIPAGKMEECIDANTALIGWSVLTTATRNDPGGGYGLLQTIDTMGAGTDGRRHVPAKTVMQEWIFQQAFLTSGVLMTRQKINTRAWTPWVKRW